MSFSFWNFVKVCELAGVKYMTPPLGLLTVASILPEDCNIRLVDENVKDLQESDIQWADLVLLSSKCVHRSRALDVIKWVKRLGKTIAVGGPDITTSQWAYEDIGIDYICLGEGEVTIPLLMADFKAGKTNVTYKGKGEAELTTVKPPKWDLIDFSDYLYVGIQYSRGCPYTCEFCNVIDLFEGSFRCKTEEQLVEELDALHAAGYRGQVDFFDDNFAGNFSRAKSVLKVMAKWLKDHRYPFQFSTSVTINIAKDTELLELFREARFKFFLVGIETPDEKSLDIAQKGQNLGFSLVEAAHRIFKIAGATIHSGFLFGMDGEPDDIADRVIKCTDECKIPWVMAGTIYPIPDTRLAKRLDSEGRLFPSARQFDDNENLRDQITAGIQFVPQRPIPNVLGDLLKVLKNAFDPDVYFRRCREVALELDTVPNIFPGLKMFVRNIKLFARLCAFCTRRSDLRAPYWKSFFHVLFRNPRGIESLVTLTVLYAHFYDMMPFAYKQLEMQIQDVKETGEKKWIARKLEQEETPIAERAPFTRGPVASAQL